MKNKKKTIILIVIILLLLIGVAGAIFLTQGGKTLLSKLASSATFNTGEYIKPDYEIDGVLDEEIWEKAPSIVFGNYEKEADEVTFRYYYGERGITVSFVVRDPYICHATNLVGDSGYKTSDAVFMYLDVKNDGQMAAQTDDLAIGITPDGRMSLQKGNGSSWVGAGRINLDYQVVVDGDMNKSDGDELDKSWTAEFFLPYKTFGIDKESTMGLMLRWINSDLASKEGTIHNWYKGSVLPELFHPIDKNGLAFAAPENWVPSMGRLLDDGKNGMVADDVRAVAFYTGQKMQNGAGTLEATIDLTQTEDFFTISRFSGLLLGVEEVGETETPGWEAKNQYGVFISNHEDNPQLVVASIRVDEAGKVTYQQLAGGSIHDALPNFSKDKVCTVKIAKNDGWIEVYVKDAEGKYYHLYDVFDIEPINGDYIGVRAAVKGVMFRDIKVSTDAPAAPNPYKGKDVKVYSGLIQKLNDELFCAKTAGTVATFGSLVNKHNVKELKTITTSIKMPEAPTKSEDKIKGIMLNYDPTDKSYLILDYRHTETWEEDWRFYIREREANKWGDVAFAFAAEANTTYDLRITPIENEKGLTEVFVEYKKSTETEWKSNYCKMNGWKMSGSEYGVQTGTGDMTFGAMKKVDLGYSRLDEGRYQTLRGMFFGRTEGGAQVMAKHSAVIDKKIDLAKQNSYMIHSSYQIVPDKTDSIKGIVFNYDEETGSYMVLDYRYLKEEYRLYVRYYDGKKWASAEGYNVTLTENAWYDFNIHVVNGKKTTTVVVEYKTGDADYIAVSRTFKVAVPGRNVGYYSTAANGLQFGEITTGKTTYIGAEDERYTVKAGSFLRTDMGVTVGEKHSTVIDKKINLAKKDSYMLHSSYQVVPDKTGSIKGIVFNYDEETQSYMVLDYRYLDDNYRLYVRYYDGKKWADTQGYNVILTENAWYDFNIHVVNGEKTTTVVVEYKTGDADYIAVSRTFKVATPGRKAGYYSTVANGIQFGEITTGKTTYIGAEDERYVVKTGSFFRTEEGVTVGEKHSLMLDEALDLSLRNNYTVETSFKVVPDQTGSLKGIVLNYDKETGSYAILDYRYVKDGYYLYIRYYNGKSWTDTWGTNVALKENAWYDFRINIANDSKSTVVNLSYKTGSDKYQRISHTFAYAMPGRQMGYYSTAANGMQYGLIEEVKSTDIGISWPNDWKDALKNKLK